MPESVAISSILGAQGILVVCVLLSKGNTIFEGTRVNQLRLLLFALAAVLTVAFWARLNDKVASGGFVTAVLNFPEMFARAPPTPLLLQDPSARLEQQFASIPAYAAYTGRLKAYFPAEYQRIIDSLVLRLASADLQTAAAGGVDKAFFQAVRHLRQTHGILAAHAQDEAMELVASTQGRLMQVLATHEPRLCVDFFYGGAEPEFYTFMGQNRALASDYANAWLEAIASGKAKNIQRAEPDDGDVQLFDDGLAARGLSRAEIDTLLESKPANPPLPDAAMCRAGIEYFKALAVLPPETRLRLMAHIFALAART